MSKRLLLYSSVAVAIKRGWLGEEWKKCAEIESEV